MKKIKPAKVSKAPPLGWPSKEQWQEAEKNLKNQLPIKILSERASPVEKAKYEICVHFIRYFNENKITQREMAQKLEVPDSRVSEILHYHLERFTIDKLLELLARIKPGVRLKVA